MKCAIVRTCMENTTAHGVVYTVSGRTIIQKVLWIFLVLLALAFFLYFFVENLKKYLDEPISVSMEPKGVSFVPPDLYLCPILAFSSDRVENTGESEKVEWEKELELINKEIKEDEELKGKYLSFFWANIDKEGFYENISHPVDKLGFYIELNSVPKNINLTAVPNIRYFACQKLSLSQIKRRWTTSDMLNLYYHIHNEATNDSTIKKLNEVPLDLLHYSLPFPSTLGPRGMVVMITAPDVYPHENTHSVLVTPERQITIQLKMQQTDAVNTRRQPCSEKNERIEYKNPLLGADEPPNKYRKGFADCKYNKSLEIMWKDHENCRCIPYNIPISISTDKPLCLEMSDANSDYMKQIECEDLFQDILSGFNDAECNPEEPCTTITYSTSVWDSEWPDEGDELRYVKEAMNKVVEEAGEGDLKLNMSDPDSNLGSYGLISISVAETKSMLIKEQISYDWVNFICETGGIAGLFSGMSFLTFLELINIAHDLIYMVVVKKNPQDNPVESPGSA